MPENWMMWIDEETFTFYDCEVDAHLRMIVMERITLSVVVEAGTSPRALAVGS